MTRPRTGALADRARAANHPYGRDHRRAQRISRRAGGGAVRRDFVEGVLP